MLRGEQNRAFALPLADGCLPVPDGLGLGVELDPKQASDR
jgi:L-alanine-DL-glutamate epimerase-like enolase superfamily enzyme